MPSHTIIEFFQQQPLLFHPFSLLSLLILLIVTYKWISSTFITKKNTPPSPPRLPIIGNLHQFGSHPYRSLEALSQKYGDIMSLQLGSRQAIVVSSAEFASQILKTHDQTFASRPHLRVLSMLLGDGKDVLLSPYGDYWKKLRSICVMQLLSTKRVRSFSNIRVEEVDLMVEGIKGASTVNLSEMFMTYSIDIICRVAFGKKYGGEEVGMNFKEILHELVEMLGGHYVGDYVTWLAWVDKVRGVDGQVRKLNKKFDDFFEVIIKEHEAKRRERVGDGENEMRDLVDVLLEGQRDGGGFFLDNDGIKALIIDIFGGGSDTTYISLEWFMSEMIRNPRVMKELQKEVRGIAGDKQTLTEDDLENMNYLRAVIKETIRLHPPSPMMAPHFSMDDVKLNGYDIPAGTLAIVNVYAISRNPAHWDEPLRFNPERFLNSTKDFKGQDFEFIPFGSGRRICPGIGFASASIELAAANLVNQFDWALPNGASADSLEMMEAAGITTHRENPLILVPTPRFG